MAARAANYSYICQPVDYSDDPNEVRVRIAGVWHAPINALLYWIKIHVLYINVLNFTCPPEETPEEALHYHTITKLCSSGNTTNLFGYFSCFQEMSELIDSSRRVFSFTFRHFTPWHNCLCDSPLSLRWPWGEIRCCAIEQKRETPIFKSNQLYCF